MNILYARHWLNPQKKANIVFFIFSLLWAIFRGSVNHKPNTLSHTHTHTQTYSYVLTASASDISNFIGQFGFKECMAVNFIVFRLIFLNVDFKFGSRTSNMKCSLKTIIHMAASRNFFVCKKYRANGKKSESKRENECNLLYITNMITRNIYCCVSIESLKCSRLVCYFGLPSSHMCCICIVYNSVCSAVLCCSLSVCARCVVGKLQKLHGNQSDNQYSQLTTKRTHQNITITAALHIEYLLSYTVCFFFSFFSSLFVAPFGLMLCIPWMCYDNKSLCSCLPLSIAFNSAQIQCAQQKRTRAIW